MSVKVTTHLWHSELEGSALLIGLALADHANDGGDGIEAGRKYLAWKTGLSERTVSSFLADFRSRGWLEIMEQPAPGRATCYKLHYDRIPKKSRYPIRASHDNAKGANSAPDGPKGEKSALVEATSANSAHERAQNGSNPLHPILNHTTTKYGEKTTAKGANSAPFDAMSGSPRDPTTKAWLELPDAQLTTAELKARDRYREQLKKSESNVA